MEPSDIDKLIRDKLSESHDLHKQEIDSAKPFIWSAVQNQIGKTRSLKWYHLAAAIAFLMIAFSFVIYSLQKTHRNEIDRLSDKMDQLENKYTSQRELLQTKDAQLDSLGNELRNIELKFTGLRQRDQVPLKEHVIYQTDTVYVKQFEYITEEPEESKEIAIDSMRKEQLYAETTKAKEMETEDAIFSNYSKQDDLQQSESLKLKFGSFTTRNN